MWDMKQYFRPAHIPAKDRVTITTVYLTSDAKPWWRTCDEENSGRPKVLSWKALCKELNDQFLPCNTVRVARDSFKKLKHTTSIQFLDAGYQGHVKGRQVV